MHLREGTRIQKIGKAESDDRGCTQTYASMKAGIVTTEDDNIGWDIVEGVGDHADMAAVKSGKAGDVSLGKATCM